MPDLPAPLPVDLTAILAALRGVLVHSCGQQLGRILISVTYEISREGVCWTLPANESPWPEEMVRALGPSLPLLNPDAPRNTSTVVTLDDLQPEEVDILRMLLREGRLLGKVLASRLHVADNGTLRGHLSRLKKLLLIENPGRRGYALTPTGRALLGATDE